jgi:hypothetical protein
MGAGWPGYFQPGTRTIDQTDQWMQGLRQAKGPVGVRQGVEFLRAVFFLFHLDNLNNDNR